MQSLHRIPMTSPTGVPQSGVRVQARKINAPSRPFDVLKKEVQRRPPFVPWFCVRNLRQTVLVHEGGNGEKILLRSPRTQDALQTSVDALQENDLK
jgi:hypothetical protein